MGHYLSRLSLATHLQVKGGMIGDQSIHFTPSLILSDLLRDQSVTLFTIVTLPSIKDIRLGVKWAIICK